MKKILLTMLFWTDGQSQSTRERNVKFTFPKIIDLTEFLNKNNIECEFKLYDFSPIKVIYDSIHIPYELGDYKRSEKINLILKQNENFDFVFMFDCDTFFNESNFLQILNIINNLEKGDIVTFDAAKLKEEDLDLIFKTGNVDEKTTDWWYAYSGEKKYGPLNGRAGGLGGVFICDIDLILGNGGFDEKYVGWGGEDGDMLDRIINSKKLNRLTPTRDFAPYHLPHFVDLNNEKYNKRFK